LNLSKVESKEVRTWGHGDTKNFETYDGMMHIRELVQKKIYYPEYPEVDTFFVIIQRNAMDILHSVL